MFQQSNRTLQQAETPTLFVLWTQWQHDSLDRIKTDKAQIILSLLYQQKD